MIWLISLIAALVGIALIARLLLGRGRRINEGLRTTDGLDAGGAQFLLHVEDASLLGVGSPVFFRRVKVGRVAECEPDGGGRGALLRILVNAPHDNFEGVNTRFWHTSRFDLQLISSDAAPSTPLFASFLLWGIAFGATDDTGGPAARSKTSFALVGDEPRLRVDDSK
ncbi:paraquat-inducible protein B [Variovorax sp. YR634]|jgi:paraquat-inducible protein B|uniref:hypothetical protein n=1 Tax=Variovorax sp. YR634 TaxID=1884385 RepID=UPI0008981E97|nr:hypothetical protein [Variovorax sp. YR634]SDX95685.1 paraquat-inducible protein B [Variovorax sp. YR634]